MAARPTAPQLIVSLSGLSDSPESLQLGAAFTAALDARGVPVSQLFRPRTAAGATGPDAPLARFLHERRAAGDAVVLHGYDHTADPLGNWRSATPARVGRRAEFAALPRHEAGLRLTAARRTLTALGLRTDLFVPPRWLASAGTAQALAEQGFGVLADENGVRLLQEGTVVRARLLGFRASGERHPVADDQRSAESWRARVLVAEVARTARRGGLVRINVRAKDLRRPGRCTAALNAVDRALAVGAVPRTYRSPEVSAAA